MFEGTLILASAWQRAPHHRPATRRFRRGSPMLWWTGVRPKTFVSGLPSPWGRLFGWNYTHALSPDWWNRSRRRPLGLLAKRTWTRWRSSPAPMGHRGSSKWRMGGSSLPVPNGPGRFTRWLFTNLGQRRLLMPRFCLPIAGQYSERGDFVAVFPMHTLHATTKAVRQPVELASTAAQVHAALVAEATPNTERRWNERLKAMEDQLKTTTLWRAPHTKHVVGLPSTNIRRGRLRRHERQHRLAPFPRPLVDHLIAPDERLPGVATMAMMEQRLSLAGMFDDAKAERASTERGVPTFLKAGPRRLRSPR